MFFRSGNLSKTIKHCIYVYIVCFPKKSMKYKEINMNAS